VYAQNVAPIPPQMPPNVTIYLISLITLLRISKTSKKNKLTIPTDGADKE